MDSPRLSVVIPTHNRKAILERCLQALAVQTLPPAEFEVIVVDDGSSDGTPEALPPVPRYRSVLTAPARLQPDRYGPEPATVRI